MKKCILIPIILGIILFGFLTGLYIYKITSVDENKEDMEIANKEIVEDECTAEYELLEEIKAANAQKEKISPNAKLITKVYYDGCGHTVKNTDIVQQEHINLTEEEFAEEYEDWEISQFSRDEIILSKTEEGICNEHYIIKEKDGYIAIYSLDENDNETLEDITEISTVVLPNTDLVKLQGGMRAYGKESLYSLLEDFE